MTRGRTFILYLVCLLGFAMPHGIYTAKSLSRDNPNCSAKVAEVYYSCRATAPATPLSTVDDITAIYGFNDQAGYAYHARNLVTQGFAQAYSAVQPPGLVLIEAAMYAVSRSFPLGLGLIVVATCLWAALFTVMASAFSARGVPYLLSILPPVVLFLTSSLGEELGFGIWLSDCYASIFCLLSMALLTVSTTATSPRLLALASGVALALAAYMRAQMDIIALLMTASTVAILLFAFAARRLWPAKLKFRLSRSFVQAFVVMLVTYHALTLPYRIWNGGQWVVAAGFDNVWPMIWAYPNELPPEWAFFSDGGGTVGCVVDAVRCTYLHDLRLSDPAAVTTALYKHLTLTSIATHPLGWFQFKLEVVFAGWNHNGEGYALALAGIWLIAAIVRHRGPTLLTIGMFIAATAAGVLGPLALLHLEIRYLDPLKLMVICACILAVASSGSFLPRMRGAPEVPQPGGIDRVVTLGGREAGVA